MKTEKLIKKISQNLKINNKIVESVINKLADIFHEDETVEVINKFHDYGLKRSKLKARKK